MVVARREGLVEKEEFEDFLETARHRLRSKG
jgi:hypothetical protein